MKNRKALGRRIRELRLRRIRQSLSQFALKVGVSKGYMSQIETGKAENPSDAVMETIAEKLNTTLEQLEEG